MSDIRKLGETSNVVRFPLRNSSTYAPLTGLTFASSGLIVSTITDNEAAATAYTAAGSTIETVTTLGTFAAPTATKCRFREVDATNHPGLYELQFANARFAVAGAKRLIVTVSGAANLETTSYEIQFDPQVDAIRMSGTALTARDIGASVLISSGTGTGQVSLSAGLVNVNGLNSNALNQIAGALPNLDGIADAVWDETITAHINTDSAAEAISIARDEAGGLSASDVRDAVGLGSANLDAQFSGIPVAVRDVNNDNPAASSFGASAKAATELPGATDVATAVRVELATELARIDVDVSSRAATGDEMDLIDAPNATAVSAIQDGLATSSELTTVGSNVSTVLGQTGTTGVLLADSEDVYPADIQFTRDDTNSKDEYTVLWFRNGTPVTSGITTPLIQVVKRADGTDLIASTAMTQIGSTGAYKYDESTVASRVADGEAVVVICTATINGSARSWRKTITRDDTN